MKDEIETSAILIEWGVELYGVWCQRCNAVTETRKTGDHLRCCQCNWIMGEKLDPDYVDHLQGKRHGNVH